MHAAGFPRVMGQFGVVAASLPRQVAASRSDRDRFRRLYIKLTHYLSAVTVPRRDSPEVFYRERIELCPERSWGMARRLSG
jgi:hypothetical protein